jgi:hypothetical protein
MKIKNPAAVTLGRLGGLASAKTRTAAERRTLAQKAIQARWRKAKRKTR